MKAIRLVFLLFPAAVLAAADSAPKGASIAVFDFKTDWHTDFKLGVTDAGEPFASLLAIDLSGLPPFTMVERAEVQKEQELRKVALDSPMAPKEAAELGASLDASVLVSGRLYKSGSDLIAAAKVMSAETGQVSGTVVKGDISKPMSELVSRLAIQVGDIIRSQQGSPPAEWKSAMIVGTSGAVPPSAGDSPTYVESIDGTKIADAAAGWNQSRPLLPGVHEIVIKHEALPNNFERQLLFIAKPGAAYEVKCLLFQRQRLGITIREIGSHDPVTVILVPPKAQDSWGAPFLPGWTFDSEATPGNFQAGMPIPIPASAHGK